MMVDQTWTGEKNESVRENLAESSSATEAVRGVWGSDFFGVDNPWSTGAGTAGSWTFDREQIDAVIRQWEDLRADLEHDYNAIRDMMANAVPPSGDDPSNKFVQLVADGLRSLQESNDSMFAYVQDFLSKLNQTKIRIGQTEAENVDPFQATMFRARP